MNETSSIHTMFSKCILLNLNCASSTGWGAGNLSPFQRATNRRHSLFALATVPFGNHHVLRVCSLATDLPIVRRPILGDFCHQLQVPSSYFNHRPPARVSTSLFTSATTAITKLQSPNTIPSKPPVRAIQALQRIRTTDCDAAFENQRQKADFCRSPGAL
jgi:hypothetical protein